MLGTYAFLNEVVSIADLVAYSNVLIINLVSNRKQPCLLNTWIGVSSLIRCSLSDVKKGYF